MRPTSRPTRSRSPASTSTGTGSASASRCSSRTCSRASGPYDLILCNPPYVNDGSMAALPAEYRAEPELALAGGDDGMDLVRRISHDAPTHMTVDAVLVLEIGNERVPFRARVPAPRGRVARDQRRRRPGRAGRAPRPATERACATSPSPAFGSACGANRGMLVLYESPCAAASSWCSTRPASRCSPARRSAWSAATAPASRRCSRCSPAACTPMPATSACRRAGASPRSRRRCPRPPRARPISCCRATRGLMEAQAALARPRPTDDGHAMADAHHAISDAGGFDARPRAQSMLLGLGFKRGELDAPVNSSPAAGGCACSSPAR